VAYLFGCVGIGELKDEIKGTNERLDRAYSQHWTDRQRRCHQAFKISNYEEQKNINPIGVKGTCQWALQNPEYIRWWESKYNDLLWVSADPGCGKSVLARSIIDEGQASSPVTMCFFFFKDNDEQNHLATALCSILHQLFSQRPYLLHHAIPSWEKNGERLQQEVDELWQIFTTAALADVSHKTICIFDALDECREVDQGQLIKKLQAFHCQSLTKDPYLKFLVTSRPYDHIQDHFRTITDSFPYIHIKGEEENDQIGEEIDLVVKIRMRELAETVPLSPDVHQRVQQQLLQMENRTYLWLHLAIDDIRTTFKRSLRLTESSITLIPPSVNAAYEKILCRVPVDQTDTVKKILEIIVAAGRSLTVREMAMALGIATCLGPRTTTQAGLDPVGLDEKIRQLCGLFVFTNHSKIYLIHQTAREFLIKKSSNNLNFASWSSLSDAEDQMAEICLRYLLMEDLEICGGKSGSNVRNFLEYSAVHWPDHVRHMSSTAYQLTDLLHRVYNTIANRFPLWFSIFWNAIERYEELPSIDAIHLAAFNGHEQVVRSLCAQDESVINIADGEGSYPVIWASLNGNSKIVQGLLDLGAYVNVQGGPYGNALQAACSKGHDNTVQVLLEHGADANALGGGWNALQVACFNGHHKIVQVLLEHGADVNAPSGGYANALQVACFEGHDKIVQVLLEYGADVNTQDEFYGNTLRTACLRGQDKIVKVLLEHGAYVNVQSEDGLFITALQAAHSQGHDEIVQVLQLHSVAQSVSHRRPCKRSKTS
jgi:ankyrin repeat protein